MKILMLHNSYQFPGGEDRAFMNDQVLLRSHGHTVLTYTISNHLISQYSRIDTVKKTFWNQSVYNDIRKLCAQSSPDLVHCHNFFPLLSPSIYVAAQDNGIPILQTLHNFRLLCLNGVFVRNGQICTQCAGKFIAWPGILYGCYRQDRMASLVSALMFASHRLIRTWQTKINLYLALSKFSKKIFVNNGIPDQIIKVHINYVADPGEATTKQPYFLYIGRLSPEKGIHTLIEVIKQWNSPFELKIAGNGPLTNAVQASMIPPKVKYLGHVSNQEAISLIKNAYCVLFPSICYENQPFVLLEALACGTPVIASDLGGIPELVQDGVTGLLVNPGDAQDMLSKIDRISNNAALANNLSKNARKIYLDHHTEEAAYTSLINIYSSVLNR